MCDDQGRQPHLVIVEKATHEPIIVGDFVRLASGSPLGLVVACASSVAEVAWLIGAGNRDTIPCVCLRPITYCARSSAKGGKAAS